jgi:hypothetical protein
LDFDVPYFEKITYPEDLVKAEAILQWKEKSMGMNAAQR